MIQVLPVPGDAFKLGALAAATYQTYPGLATAVSSAGLGLAVAFENAPFTVRADLANILLLYPNLTPNLYSILDWNTGVEVGYRFFPGLEGTVGITGIQQILRLDYSF